MDKEVPFYSVKEVNKLRLAAQYYELDAPVEYWRATGEELQKACNGAGPDRWSHNKRRAVTAALDLYEPAYTIHDVEYEYLIGTQKTSDKRLKRNMIKIWKKHFGWRRWITLRGIRERIRVIPFVYAAVAIGGGQAWEEAKYDDEK